jgi:quercetin dioxygenase-like cupin family protein
MKTHATEYTLIPDLIDLVEGIKPDSIISRTFLRADNLKAIAFGFDAGQELSEHTSAHPAVVQIIQGEATVTLGNDRHELGPGSWLYMPAKYRHSVFAKTQLVLLLLMVGKN